MTTILRKIAFDINLHTQKNLLLCHACDGRGTSGHCIHQAIRETS